MIVTGSLSVRHANVDALLVTFDHNLAVIVECGGLFVKLW